MFTKTTKNHKKLLSIGYKLPSYSYVL
jgi:hypothetical protein